MKKLFILLLLFIFLGQLELSAMKPREIPGIKGKELTGLELLKAPTQFEKVHRDMERLYGELFAKDDILKESFAPKERSDWLAALRQFTTLVDSKPDVKKDRDVFSAYQSVTNVINQLVDIQPKLVTALGNLSAKADQKVRGDALKQIAALENTLKGFVSSMTGVTNTYETLSKKLTAKLWSPDKKEVWKIINTFAEFAKAGADKLTKNLQKSRERSVLVHQA